MHFGIKIGRIFSRIILHEKKVRGSKNDEKEHYLLLWISVSLFPMHEIRDTEISGLEFNVIVFNVTNEMWFLYGISLISCYENRKNYLQIVVLYKGAMKTERTKVIEKKRKWKKKRGKKGNKNSKL